MTSSTAPHDLLHGLARSRFEVFLELGFRHLNPTTKLSRGWYLSAMANLLEQAERGEVRRVIITIPPRHLKSITASILFPAWLLGRNRALRIISVSYNAELAAQLANDFRKIMTSAWYAAVFPETARSIARNTDVLFSTRQGGSRLAATVGGPLTGFGADVIICDDLMKAIDTHSPEARLRVKRFVDETLLTRFNDPRNGTIISIQQRLCEDDIVAHLLEKGGFRHLNLPAIAVKDEDIPLTRGRIHRRRIGDLLDPHRHPTDEIERQRADLGARAFEAQYQQNPLGGASGYTDWAKIQFYDEAPPREEMVKVAMSWDTALSDTPQSSWSVCTVWGYCRSCWHLVDLIRARLDYAGLLARARAERLRWRADLILVENACLGSSLLTDLRRDLRSPGPNSKGACPAIKISADQPKEVRLQTALERLYSGFARLPRVAPFLDELQHEMCAFPGGRYSDQCDSLSQFIIYASSRRGGALTRPSERPRRGRAMLRDRFEDDLI